MNRKKNTVVHAVRSRARKVGCGPPAGWPVRPHVERPIVVTGRRRWTVIHLLKKTLRFLASGEQLTLQRFFSSGVFDEPAITAGLNGRKRNLGRGEGGKQGKQQPDAERFRKS